MKKSSLIIAFSLLSVLSFSSKTLAQEKPFIVFEYMHVKPDNNTTYLQVENFWRHIHLAQQKKGDILGWSVWEVVAPYNMHARYQYVVQTAYAHFSDILHPYKGIDTKQIFPNASEDFLKQMFSETGKARDLIRRDIFSPEGHAGNGISTNYMMVSYLKVPPDKEQSFESFMRDHRMPISEKIVKGGFADFWWYGGLMFGKGDKGHYNHIVCYQWKYDQMFDKLPPFAQYKKEDPASADGYKWYTMDHTELLHKVLSLESPAKQ